ncbi:hypothetical protein EfmJHP10_25520 [Enterococcus faecium]|nr:hypothetical protein EfmJHP10_25520 [Enterococcus faecium]
MTFGSTSRQKLFKLELPLAKSTIMAGINQTTMLSLSMVVIASMEMECIALKINVRSIGPRQLLVLQECL